MSYQELVSQIFILIAVLVVLVNIITEVTKKIVNFGDEKKLNIFVVVLSVILTVAVLLAYWQIKQLEIVWYLVLAFIVIGLMVAYAAMFGYDKLLKYFEKFKS